MTTRTDLSQSVWRWLLKPYPLWCLGMFVIVNAARAATFCAGCGGIVYQALAIVAFALPLVLLRWLQLRVEDRLPGLILLVVVLGLTLAVNHLVWALVCPSLMHRQPS